MSEVGIVVGVGPGLGWALVRRFAKAGLGMVACARDPRDLEPLARADGIDVKLEACDATKPADVARVFDKLDPAVAIFNAGAFQRGGILEITPETFERCWKVGCFAGFLVGQAAARPMAAKGSGTILFTGATASLRGGAGFANLAVGKFGLRAVAQSMARELGPKGVHVAHVIIDGHIEAPRFPAEEIAENYYRLHAQPRGAWTHELDLRPADEKF